jgi:hypothetical protein
MPPGISNTVEQLGHFHFFPASSSFRLNSAWQPWHFIGIIFYFFKDKLVFIKNF